MAMHHMMTTYSPVQENYDFNIHDNGVNLSRVNELSETKRIDEDLKDTKCLINMLLQNV